MAKWGEGDPRWIVEERADATNVNNWHWTEKNATLWSKDKLKELLTSVKVENDEFLCKIKEVKKCDGEASANNRKAKLIFFYEWVIELEWEGELKNSENKTVYKGKIEIPNLSEEHEPSDVGVEVSIENDKQNKLKEFMRTEGAKELRKQFGIYIKLLKEEFSQGLILPTNKDAKSQTQTSDKTKPPPPTTTTASGGDSTSAKSSTNGTVNGCKIETKKLKLVEEFKCRASELYQVFTDINMVRVFTQSPNVVYEAEKGGKFSLFDSNITGSFIEFDLNKKITMNWRYKQWPSEHYSVATLDFEEKDDCTKLILNQTGIPQNFLDNTEEGWKRFYWSTIKQAFGFGARLI